MEEFQKQFQLQIKCSTCINITYLLWNTFLEINITKKLEFSSDRNFVSYLFLSEMFISKIVFSSKNYVLLLYDMGEGDNGVVRRGLGLGRDKGTLES